MSATIVASSVGLEGVKFFLLNLHFKESIVIASRQWGIQFTCLWDVKSPSAPSDRSMESLESPELETGASAACHIRIWRGGLNPVSRPTDM